MADEKNDSGIWQYQAEVDKFGEAFDLLNDQVMILDRNAIIRYANPAMTKKTGYPRSQFIGKNPREVWGGHMPKDFYGELWYTVKQEKHHFVGEIRNKRVDGSEYIEELHVSPVLGADKEVKYFIGVAFDISNRKTANGYKQEHIINEKENADD